MEEFGTIFKGMSSDDLRSWLNFTPAIHEYYHIAAKEYHSRKSEVETITITKTLFNRLVNLYCEADYQIKFNVPSMDHLTIERNNCQRVLTKEFPNLIKEN